MQNQMNKAIPILFATNIAAFLGILSILVLPGFVHPDRLGVPRSNLLADVLGSLRSSQAYSPKHYRNPAYTCGNGDGSSFPDC